jgi:hypothetical protein
MDEETVDDPTKKAKNSKSFALYVGGKEVYEKDKADALEAELEPLVGGSIVEKMFKYDSAHQPTATAPRIRLFLTDLNSAGCHTAPSSRSREGTRAV